MIDVIGLWIIMSGWPDIGYENVVVVVAGSGNGVENECGKGLGRQRKYMYQHCQIIGYNI